MESDKRPLPEGWRWARLGDMCEVQTGTCDPRSEPDKPFRYVDITSVDNVSKRIVAAKSLVGRDAPSRARQIIRTGDVLVATTRPNLNAVALVPSELDNEVCSTGFCVLRPKSELCPDYLFAFVQSREFVGSLSDSVKGAMYPAVSDNQVRAELAAVPHLAEQKRIAAILNEQMAAVERARAAAEARLEAAKSLPAAYLRAVFSNSQGRQWPKRRLGDISKLLPSKSIATNGDSEVQAITTACLSEGGFLSSGIKTGRMWAMNLAGCAIARGEVLVARSNTPELVGRVAMFPGEPKGIVASDLTIRIWPGNEMRSEFLTAYLSFLYQTGYWKERAGGASGSMKKITREQIQAEQVPVPRIDEQERIAAMLNEQMASASRTRKATEEELDTINKLPAALLRRAFRGGL